MTLAPHSSVRLGSSGRAAEPRVLRAHHARLLLFGDRNQRGARVRARGASRTSASSGRPRRDACRRAVSMLTTTSPSISGPCRRPVPGRLALAHGEREHVGGSIRLRKTRLSSWISPSSVSATESSARGKIERSEHALCPAANARARRHRGRAHCEPRRVQARRGFRLSGDHPSGIFLPSSRNFLRPMSVSGW